MHLDLRTHAVHRKPLSLLEPSARPLSRGQTRVTSAQRRCLLSDPCSGQATLLLSFPLFLVAPPPLCRRCFRVYLCALEICTTPRDAMSTSFKFSDDLESAKSRSTTLVPAMPILAPVASRTGPRHQRTISGSRRLERIPSIQLPAPVAPRARLPGEFRTLSFVATFFAPVVLTASNPDAPLDCTSPRPTPRPSRRRSGRGRAKTSTTLPLSNGTRFRQRRWRSGLESPRQPASTPRSLLVVFRRMARTSSRRRAPTGSPRCVPPVVFRLR